MSEATRTRRAGLSPFSRDAKRSAGRRAPLRVAAKPTRARLAYALFALLLLALPACHQKMGVQPSYHPLEPTEFFADGRSSRPPVAGTVARGQLRIDRALYEGVERDPKTKDDRPVSEFPFAMTEAVLKRGEQRFNIFCAVCHGVKGWGDGRIVQRGFTRPTSFLYEINDRGVLTDHNGNPLKEKARTFTYSELGDARRAGIKPLGALSRGYKLREQEKSPEQRMTMLAAPVGYLYQVITKGYGAMPDHAEQIPVNDRWAIVGYVKALQHSQMPELREKKAAPKGDKK